MLNNEDRYPTVLSLLSWKDAVLGLHLWRSSPSNPWSGNKGRREPLLEEVGYLAIMVSM
jgi:hypothetical protein